MKQLAKLKLGALSASLGFSLVIGGTWAAFNDIEKIQNTVAAGELNLEVEVIPGLEDTFILSDLKPGDEMTRVFLLDNAGTLAIKEVLLTTIATGFQNGTTNEYVTQTGQDNNLNQFLEQFEVEAFWVAGSHIVDLDPNPLQMLLKDPNFRIIDSEDKVNLKDLITNNFPSSVVKSSDGRLNLAPNNNWNLVYDGDQFDGIPVKPDDQEVIVIKMKMKDDGTRETSGPAIDEYKQNRYQGDSVQVTFSLEAKQWNGAEINQNGYIQSNEKAHNGNY